MQTSMVTLLLFVSLVDVGSGSDHVETEVVIMLRQIITSLYFSVYL